MQRLESVLNSIVATKNKTAETNLDSSGMGLDLLQLCRFATERSPMPIAFVEGPGHRLIYANPAFCTLCQKEREAVMGRPFCDLVRQDARNQSRLLLDRVYSTGSSETITDQEHNGVGNPATYWSYTAWPVFGETNAPNGVMVQMTNTTETSQHRVHAVALNEALVLSAVRQHEEAETLNTKLQRAMMETHHRLKNNLQVIAALAEMPIQKGHRYVPVTALRRIGQHVRNLAILHDVLTQQARYGADTEFLETGVVLDLLVSLEAAMIAPRRIVQQIKPISLPVQKLGSFSMMASELLNNSIKHSTSDITIRFERVGRNAVFSVSDHGKGFPEHFDPKHDAHTGLELIQTLARYDLRGEVKFSNQDGGGACVTVTFPIPAESIGETESSLTQSQSNSENSSQDAVAPWLF